ncbi:matrixin family metalloprotease [Lacipirellula sp.]|uniref:matrixin family metalloprotease n=1 Tax=Lacipirellula sp. TaxID=2691419 RepID=UPI003D0BDA63
MRLPLNVLLGVTAAVLISAGDAAAFYSNGRWASTASSSPTAAVGFPVTLTWSLVPDGTPLSSGGVSNLVAFLDGRFNYAGGGSDLTLRPWFGQVSQSFTRWTDLSGLTFAFEATDDGATHGNFAGALGIRGDVRLAGKFIDGVGGTNAMTGFIPSADLTVDTGDSPYFGASANNYRAMRNTLMHEIGHSFGLGHVDSNSAAFLMEGFSNNSFDGPQLDDIRGIQWLYGDKYERLAGAGGNGSIAQATPLGIIADGATLTLGADAATGTLVLENETNFVSIANSNDVDYFAFTVTEPSSVDLTLTPRGASYNERIGGTNNSYTTTNAAQASNLSLELYGLVNGVATLLASAATQPIGVAELLTDIELPTAADYFVRVAGDSSNLQFYELAIGVAHTPVVTLPGDFDLDGDVDGADFLVWQSGFGSSYDADDLAIWREHFGATSPITTAVATVPEPIGALLMTAAFAGLGLTGRLRSAAGRRWLNGNPASFS